MIPIKVTNRNDYKLILNLDGMMPAFNYTILLYVTYLLFPHFFHFFCFVI